MGLTFWITVNQRAAAYDINHYNTSLQQKLQVYFMAISCKYDI